MGGWGTVRLAPGSTLAKDSDIASVSRYPGHLETFYIDPDGCVVSQRWTGQWERKELLGSGTAAAGGIAALSRRKDHIEVWWITPEGAVKGLYWYDGYDDWKEYEIAPEGSAAPGSKIRCVSRPPNLMDIWWITPSGTINHGFVIADGSPWKFAQFAPPKSATVHSGLAAVARDPLALDVWWVSPSGSVEGAWKYGTSNWTFYNLAGPHSAAVHGGLRAQARMSNALNVWWISENGSVEGCYTIVGKEAFTRYQIAGLNAASYQSGLYSLYRAPTSEEIFWISPAGEIMGAYWYEGMNSWTVYQNLSRGSAKLDGAIGGASQSGDHMEIFAAAADGGVVDRFFYEHRTWSFTKPFEGVDWDYFDGRATVILKDTGELRWMGFGHAAKVDDYNFAVFGVLKPQAGSSASPIAQMHRGLVTGHWTGEGTGRRDEWNDTRSLDDVRTNFDDYVHGQFELRLEYKSGLSELFDKFFNLLAEWSIDFLLPKDIKLIAVIGIELGSFFTTGSFAAGSRIINGVLWMAGPANTLIALPAGETAKQATRAVTISKADYDWASAQVFNGTLPARERILLTDTKGRGNRPFTFPTSDNKITINVGGIPGMLENPGKFPSTLIHELVHAWQLEHVDMQISWVLDALQAQVFNPTGAYSYPAAGPPWKSFGLEQQAQIVEDWFNLKPGEREKSPYFRYIRDNIRSGFYNA